MGQLGRGWASPETKAGLSGLGPSLARTCSPSTVLTTLPRLPWIAGTPWGTFAGPWHFCAFPFSCLQCSRQ